MIDILTYILPNQVWALENHLTVAGGGQPIFTSLVGKNIWEMKGPGGFPWDMDTFDENYIYQSVTENVWTNPNTFKIFASSSWPGANGGIVWAPRYFTPGVFSPPVITDDSTYRIYTSCSAYAQQTLGGPIETHIEGPFEGEYAPNFGGTIGTPQSTIRQVYKWGPGYANMEVNYYALGLGLVQWELWNLVTPSTYTQKQVSAFNTQVSGGIPTVNFPCGVPIV